MAFSIEAAGPGTLRASGELDFATAAEALRAGLRLMSAGPRWTVDLSGVGAGDSAGLAVLIEWLSVAHSRGTDLSFESVPAQMLAIARISGLEGLLLGQSGGPGSSSNSSSSGSSRGCSGGLPS